MITPPEKKYHGNQFNFVCCRRLLCFLDFLSKLSIFGPYDTTYLFLYKERRENEKIL
jgi:hypothetical protein